jgi:hypothetical protein
MADEALQFKPDSDVDYNNMCAAYNALTEGNKAAAAGETTLILNPNNQWAANNLAWAQHQKSVLRNAK